MLYVITPVIKVPPCSSQDVKTRSKRLWRSGTIRAGGHDAIAQYGNHNVDANQVTSNDAADALDADSSDDTNSAPHPPRAILRKKVRKVSKISLGYGNIWPTNISFYSIVSPR